MPSQWIIKLVTLAEKIVLSIAFFSITFVMLKEKLGNMEVLQTPWYSGIHMNLFQ